MKDELDRAYRQTIYQVHVDTESLCFQIGQYDPRAEQSLLLALGPASEWAFLTPCNPASIPLCQHENEARLENFHNRLRSLSCRWLRSLHIDPNGQWPDERGALVFDITTDMARQIAQAFGQNAWVHTHRGHAPELIWAD